MKLEYLLKGLIGAFILKLILVLIAVILFEIILPEFGGLIGRIVQIIIDGLLSVLIIYWILLPHQNGDENMDENVEDTRSNIYPGIIAVGSMISVWVTFLIYITYPDIGKEFMFAMFISWLIMFFIWTLSDPPIHYQVEQLEREIIELKKEIIVNNKGDDEK